MFEVHDHDIVPQAQALEVAHQVRVNDSELAGQIGFDRQVAETGLNGRIHTNDVGDGGGGGNGHAIGVAHAVGGDFAAQGVPIQSGAAVDFYITAARFLQQVERVQRQHALVPQ